MRYSKTFLVSVIAFVFFVLGLIVSPLFLQTHGSIVSFPSSREQQFSVSGNNTELCNSLDSILAVLGEDYYNTGRINLDLMHDRALKGYVDALGDPYTAYLDGNEYAYLVDDLRGEQHFAGIGAVVYKKDTVVVIEEVLKNSPAALAGLRPFDMIVQVDGESVADLSIGEAVDKIRGEKGSTVTLSFLRSDDGGDAQLFQKTIVRGDIVDESVGIDYLDYQGHRFLIVELSSIGEETNDLLVRDLQEVDFSSIDGVVLDLRGNAGGFLLAGVDVASHFIAKGNVIVSTRYPSYKDDLFRSTGSGPLVTKPLVVLVDGLTASASEIIALALRDVRGVPVVGEETFGKGTIQTIHEFDHGSLKYTVGLWFSPNGTHLSTGGIIPDVPVTFNVTGYMDDRIDNQLQEAQAVLLSILD